MANLEVRLPEYDQVESRATEIKEKIDAKAAEVKAAIEAIPETDLSNVAKSSELTPLAKSTELAPLAKSSELAPLAKTGDIENATEEIKTAVENIHPEVDMTPVMEKMDQLSTLTDTIFASSVGGVCIIDIELNAGGAYELPESGAERAELLAGAVVAVSADGILNPIKTSIDSLVNFKKRLLIPASDDKDVQGYATLKLGASATCAFGAARVPVTLRGGTRRTVTLSTSSQTGEVVEVARVQPWNSTAAGAGASFIATKITNANGTRFHLGGYAPNGAWVDQSMTSVTIFDCPKDADGNPLAPQPKVIATGGSENAVPIEQRLACLRNMVEADVEIVGNNASIAGNKAMRYDPVFFKTTMETLAIPTFDADGNVAKVENTLCCIKWFCDVQADADYHRAPLFVRYERQDDGSYNEIPLRYGFIARYAIQNVNLALVGKTIATIQFKSDDSNEIGNTRDGFLGRCKTVNEAEVRISVEGEETRVFAPRSDERLFSMVNLSEITFLQWMAYLYFGNNAQASMRGISEDNTAARNDQANGKTDYIFAQGIMTGGENTASASKQILFLGIEGGLWSAPGWMFPDWSSVWQRKTTTDETGAIVSEATDHFYLFCQDRKHFAPLSSDEAALLSAGYRRVAFNPTTAGSGYRYRMGWDDSAIMRDAYLPSANAAEPNISIGGADYQWSGSFPAVIAAYSATTKYALNSYVNFEGKIYKCVEAQTVAESFDPSKWELQASTTIVRNNWYMVAIGGHRSDGLHLGPFCINANNALGNSSGSNWRSRPSLQPLIRDER